MGVETLHMRDGWLVGSYMEKRMVKVIVKTTTTTCRALTGSLWWPLAKPRSPRAPKATA